MMAQQLLPERTARKVARPNARGAAAVLPETMRAVAIERHGGPDAMALCAVPRPVPGPDEVLVALHTAGVANPEAFERLGRAAQYARLQVPIAATFALTSAAKAHQRLAAGVPGKLVLRIYP